MTSSFESEPVAETEDLFDWCPLSEQTLADAEEKLKIFERHRDATMRAIPGLESDELIDFEIDSSIGADQEQLLREMEQRHRRERCDIVAGFGKALQHLSDSLRQPAEHAQQLSILTNQHVDNVSKLEKDHKQTVDTLSDELKQTRRVLDSVASERDSLKAQLTLARATHAGDIKRIKLAVLQDMERE